MDKAEELNKAKQWMIKNYPKTESELEWGNDVDDEVVLDAMVEYAQQVNKEMAERAFYDGRKTVDWEGTYIYQTFDKWYSNH